MLLASSPVSLLNEISIRFIIPGMSEENTQRISGGDGGSFEERVFARFDAIDARFDGVDARFDGVDARFDTVDARFDTVDASLLDLDGRMQKLEVRAYETKPIWEQALKEIIDTRRELSKRLDRIEAIAHGTRADLRDAEDRLKNLSQSLFSSSSLSC